MNADPRALTIASTVFELLREAILTGQISPGARLKTDALRRDYDVGLSPVREALNRLVAEGLVVQHDQRGFFASTVNSAELADITNVRCLIGESALRASLAHGDETWEEGIILAFHRFDRCLAAPDEPEGGAFRERTALHRAFHTSLLSACGSPWLLNFWHTLFDQAQRYQALSLDHAPGVRDPRTEHRELMEVVVARSVERAVDLHNKHIRTTQHLVMPALEPPS